MITLRFLAALAYASAIDALRVRWSRPRAAILEAERARLKAIAEELARGVSVRETAHGAAVDGLCLGSGDIVSVDVVGYANCPRCAAWWQPGIGDAYTVPMHPVTTGKEPPDEAAYTDDDHAIFANRGHLRCGVCDAALDVGVIHYSTPDDFSAGIPESVAPTACGLDFVAPGRRRWSSKVERVTCPACLAALGTKPLPAVHYGPEGRPVCGAATWVGLTREPRLVDGCDECEARAMTGAEVAT